MRVAHVCTSKYRNCGIGFFSQNFNSVLSSNCESVRFLNDLNTNESFDTLILHHEYSIVNKAFMKKVMDLNVSQRILFCHSEIKPKIERAFDKFICMNDGMVNTLKPVIVEACPGYTTDVKIDGIRKLMGIDNNKPIIGNFSMYSNGRMLKQIADFLSESMPDYNIYINCPRNSNAQSAAEERMPVQRDNVFIDRRFRNPYFRHNAMKECKLIWCFSSVNGHKYASASISDMYCSGTPLIFNIRPQHHHINGKANTHSVYTLDHDVFSSRVSSIARDVKREKIEDLSWFNSFKGIRYFLES